MMLPGTGGARIQVTKGTGDCASSYPPFVPGSTWEDVRQAADNELEKALEWVELAGELVDNNYQAEAAIPPLEQAVTFLDQAFCAFVVGMNQLGEVPDTASADVLTAARRGVAVVRAMLPVIGRAIALAVEQGYDQGFINGFAAGLEAAQAKEDDWDKLLEDLKGGTKVALYILGGLAAVALVGWATSYWRAPRR
jgi:hypothetical protein